MQTADLVQRLHSLSQMGMLLTHRMKLDFHLQVMTSTDGIPHQMAPVQVMPRAHQLLLIQLQLCTRSGVVHQAQVAYQVLVKVESKLQQ
jgi:RIO-like serine/threonine protein kinase